jgi:putative SOS response-associated peptidase YedK
MKLFELNAPAAALEAFLGVRPSPSLRFERAPIPGESVLALRSRATEPGMLPLLTLEPFTARFGLVPEACESYRSADSENYHSLRLERLTYARNLAPLLIGGRCLVPATAFYRVDADHDAGQLEFWRFALPDNKPFFMAGLWTTNSKPWLRGTSLGVVSRTVEAHSSWSGLLERAPLILGEEGAEDWLKVITRQPRKPWQPIDLLPESLFTVSRPDALPRSLSASDVALPVGVKAATLEPRLSV